MLINSPKVLCKDIGNVARKCCDWRKCLLKQNGGRHGPPGGWRAHPWLLPHGSGAPGITTTVPGSARLAENLTEQQPREHRPCLWCSHSAGTARSCVHRSPDPRKPRACRRRPARPHSRLPPAAPGEELGGVSAASVLCSCSGSDPSERLPRAAGSCVWGRTCRLACPKAAYRSEACTPIRATGMVLGGITGSYDLGLRCFWRTPSGSTLLRPAPLLTLHLLVGQGGRCRLRAVAQGPPCTLVF